MWPPSFWPKKVILERKNGILTCGPPHNTPPPPHEVYDPSLTLLVLVVNIFHKNTREMMNLFRSNSYDTPTTLFYCKNNFIRTVSLSNDPRSYWIPRSHSYSAGLIPSNDEFCSLQDLEPASGASQRHNS